VHKSVPDKLEEKRLTCCNSLSGGVKVCQTNLNRKPKIQFIREGANVPPLAKDPYNANNFNIKAR